MQRIFEVEKNFINPFDVTAQPRLARGNNMTRCLEALLADETFDLIGCVLIVPRDPAGANKHLLDQTKAVAAKASKPIILFPEMTMHWNEAPPDPGVHVASSLSDGLIALRALMNYAAFRRKLSSPTHGDRAERTAHMAWPGQRQVLTEFESKRLLAARRIAGHARGACAHGGRGDGRRTFRIGFPVALKVQSPDLMHKSDAGALALGLAADEDVRRAFQRLLSNVASGEPGAAIDGVLVQEMVSGGVEILVGMKRDPSFRACNRCQPGRRIRRAVRRRVAGAARALQHRGGRCDGEAIRSDREAAGRIPRRGRRPTGRHLSISLSISHVSSKELDDQRPGGRPQSGDGAAGGPRRDNHRCRHRARANREAP